MTAVLGLSALACLPQAASADVAAPVDGSFSITPARRYVVARPPAQLTPARVSNTTRAPLRVRVIPVLLSQQPSGAFSFGASPETLALAHRMLSVAPASFTLPPGSSREVGLSWLGLAPHARTANVGVIYQAAPAVAKDQMRVVERLLNVNLMRLPGRYRVAGKLTGVHVSQAAARVLRLTLDAENTGQTFAKPSNMTLTIRHHGRRVLRRPLSSDVVLPGVTREFTLDLTRPLPAGRYTAIGRMRFGASRGLLVRASFALVGPNELPASELRVGRLVAAGEVGGRADVSAAVGNSGSAAGATQVKLDLYRLEGGMRAKHAIAHGRLDTGQVPAGGHVQLKGELGHLRKGTYRLLASYRTATGAPQTLVADFQARQSPSLLARLRGILREHLLFVPGLLLLLSAVLLALLLRERRRRRVLGPPGPSPELCLRLPPSRFARVVGGLAANAAIAAAVARRR